MRFGYELKFRDYYGYSLSHAFHSLVTQIFYVTLAMVFSYRFISDWFFFALSVVIFFGAMWLAQAAFILIYLAVGRNKNLFMKHVLAFDESGIDSETALGKGHLSWKGVVKVAKRAGGMAIYMNAHAAIFIPMRVLGGADQYQRLYDYIEQNRKTA